jgi:branched-chain amino acid transport system permease protein
MLVSDVNASLESAGKAKPRAARLVGPARAGVFFGALIVMPMFGLPHWVLNMLVFVIMFAVMSSAWNLVGGFAGYPSLGHAAFFGIGAYTLGMIFKNHPVGSGYEPFLWLPVIGLVAAAIGVPIAAVAMRTRADVFAIVTITFLFVVQTLAFNLRGVTGGAQGLALPIAPFPAATFEQPFYYVLVALLALALGLTFAFIRSKIGLSLASVRADEDKARGIGVPTTGVKVLAFSISVGLTAMAGGVWAYYESFIYPQFAVDPLITIAIVLMTFLGGRATLWGPVVGAFILETSQQYFAYQFGGAEFYLIAYALVFLVIMLFLPRGILPTIAQRLRQRARRSADGISPPEEPTAAPPSPGPAVSRTSRLPRHGADQPPGVARSAKARS